MTRRRVAAWPGLPRRRVVFVEALWALLAVAIVAVAEIAFNVFVTVVFGEQSMSSMPLGRIARAPNRLEWMAFAILAVSAAPLAEEIFFRGMLYNALRQRLPVAVAASLQAIVFGLLHPYPPSAMAQVAVIGLGLALVYEWRKTLLTPMIMHSLRNVPVAFMTAILAADAAAPRLGVFGEAHEGGFMIKRVVPASAAEAAGLQVGDVITNVDGSPVADLRSLTEVIRSKRMGQSITVTLMRRGKAARVEAVLKKLKE
jgi:membrane protease YdiL (CAAX protease family)